MLKLAKKYEDKLDCICGVCDHDCMDKSCLFNKIVNDLNPEQAQKKAVLALMGDVVKDAVSLANKKNAGKTQKTTRAKISTKKGE